MSKLIAILVIIGVILVVVDCTMDIRAHIEQKVDERLKVLNMHN
jgi:uncharacterized membrane protein